MFKFERERTPSAMVGGPSRSASDSRPIGHRAFLAWGEHCVECAAPSCYQTCDLFNPTTTGSCRRFENGISRHRNTGGRPPAADIKFLRWGKLEAQGNAKLLPAAQVAVMERVLGVVWPSANRIGNFVAQATGDKRWGTLMEALHKRLNDRLRASAKDGPLPEVFIAEIFNPTDIPAHLSLVVSIDRARLARAVSVDQLPPPWTHAIDAVPGFSRHEVPVASMHDVLGSGLPFNIAIVPVGDATPHLVFHALELASYHQPGTGTKRPIEAASSPAAASAPMVKCVVFDLDNTLWDGVLLEGKVELRAGIPELFRQLDERGILISVASKNAQADALAQLKAFGLDEYVLHPMIGWRPKSESVRNIAKALDIGVDTLLFVDDNPFERAEVAQAVPGVSVVPDTEIAMLAAHPRLQGAITPESRERRKMYQQAILRDDLATNFNGDYVAFLRTCDIRVEIRPDRPADFERVVELVQRTNQLNFSGRKYSRDDIARILDDPERERYVVSVTDKFGTYGTVGFCLAHRSGEQVWVDDFMLSCRVQGKFIEQALFWYLTELAGSPARVIHVDFRRTDRNRAAEMVMETLAFVVSDQGGLMRDVQPGAFAVDFLKVDSLGQRVAV